VSVEVVNRPEGKKSRKKTGREKKKTRLSQRSRGSKTKAAEPAREVPGPTAPKRRTRFTPEEELRRTLPDEEGREKKKKKAGETGPSASNHNKKRNEKKGKERNILGPKKKTIRTRGTRFESSRAEAAKHSTNGALIGEPEALGKSQKKTPKRDKRKEEAAWVEKRIGRGKKTVRIQVDWKRKEGSGKSGG